MLRRFLWQIPIDLLRKLFRQKWMRPVFMVLGLIGLIAAIWFGFPMTGWAPIVGVFPRLIAIGVILFALGLFYGLRWRKRRKQAQALEDSLMPEPVGDGQVLGERMQEALVKLKKAGGKNYLYDLPWYIIIGPPGAGKTTALRNAGIEFPGAGDLPDNAQGFGGTRNVDWWFAEDAVLIDTAGRYTTQDSDVEADKASWTAFLSTLKRGRPHQPINGVILAFSIEDMMKATEESLAAHAATVRERLQEINETLKIDVPVYVLFTKVDLLAGFREYYGSFNQSRRKLAWGVTFPTKDRKQETYKEVPAEFDLLLKRLSDEVIDRMYDEPDGASRIAIFGLAGQMAEIRDTVADFLRRVFEPTRYKTNAILRGFYFTSGTQEGTPFDQVLGSMAQNAPAEAGGFQPGFMSGQGKSFFLHDVLKRVIFPERDWVNYDRKSVRRGTILRTLAISTLTVATLGLMGAFGWSFWKNYSLVTEARADAAAYDVVAAPELDRTVIDDVDPTPALLPLQELRQVAGGYGDRRERTFWEGFGLSRHKEVQIAADRAYSDGLERMLRPRMILQMENVIPQLIADEDTGGIYRALKVYLVLGGQGEGKPENNDAAVMAYFEDVWREIFVDSTQFVALDQLREHTEAMLALDGDREPLIGIDSEIVRKARAAIVNLPLAAQAYASIQDRAALTGIPDFNLVERVSGAVNEVFLTTDGSPLDTVSVPALYTFEGYWGFFLEEAAQAEERLKSDQWVLGEAATLVDFDAQLTGLGTELHRLYRIDFLEAWRDMFAQIRLASMSADAPKYDLLGSFSSPVASPLRELVEAVDEETRLTRLYDQLDGLTPEQIAAGPDGLTNSIGDAAFGRIYSRSGVFSRVVLDYVASGDKIQERAGNAVSEDSQRRQVERITEDFEPWHLLMAGEEGRKPIQIMLNDLMAVREVQRQAEINASIADQTMMAQALSKLTRDNSTLPEPVARMLNSVENEFLGKAVDTSLLQLNEALESEVAQYCKDSVIGNFPFTNGRHISPSVFGEFFGNGGRMDRFYSNYLQPHVMRGPNGLEPDPQSRIGERLAPGALKQFDRAEAIRKAFFASGSPAPEVKILVSHRASSQGVDVAILTINGNEVKTLPESAPTPIFWPGGSSGVSVQLSPPAAGRPSMLQFQNGRWDIVSFMRAGRARVNGNVADVTYDIGGRSITYRFEFDAPEVPFLMPELFDFDCPTSLG